MGKYKVKSTIYLVFLLVSIIINAMFLYILISKEYEKEEKKPEEPKVEEVSLSTVQDLYSRAYDYINSDNIFINTGYKLNYNTSCDLVNFNGMEEYFTNKAIENMRKYLVYADNNYYDCSNTLNSSLFNSILGAEKRELTILVSDDNYILASSKFEYGCNEIDYFPLYMIFSKENGKWLIDSYE